MKKLLIGVVFIALIFINLGCLSAFNWDGSTQAYYRLDEQTGTNAEDIFLGHNGTASNERVFTSSLTGISNTGADFSKGNDFINISNFSYRNGDGSFSAGGWIKINVASGEQAIITQQTPATYDGFAIFYNGTGFVMRSSFSTHIVTIPTITPVADNWYFVIGTYNATSNETKLYVNGTLDGNRTAPSKVSNAGIYIGSLRGTNYLANATIDEVMVFNKTLNQSEITELYNNGNGLFYGSGINSPLDDSNYLISDDIIFSITSSGTALENITLFINDVENETKLISGALNTTTFTRQFSAGTYNWSVRTCDSGVCTNSSSYSFTVGKYVINSISYSNSTLEGSLENFTLNLSTATGIEVSSARLVYNETSYTSSFSVNGEYIITKSLSIPSISSATNESFYWNVSLSDGTSFTTDSYNQTVNPLIFDNCSTYTNELFNFSLWDEDEQTFLDGSDKNTSIKISLFLYTLSGNLILNYTKNYDKINPARICMQNNLSSSEYKLTGLVEYSSSGRFKEFYNFQSYDINNSIAGSDIYLYNLNESNGQEFKITYKDSNFVPVGGAIMQVQRKYVDEGIYKTTEIPKTGTEGYTIAHLVRNDVVYNIIVMKNGEVLASFNDIVADCQNPTLQSCEINLNSYGSSVLPDSFANYNDITFTLSYDITTMNVSSIFAIPSGNNAQVNLSVILFDSLGNTTICSDDIYSAGGELTCHVDARFTNSSAIAILYKDNEEVGRAFINLNEKPSTIYGSNILFIAMFCVLLIIGIGITDNPMIHIITLVVGLIVLVGLNIVYTPKFVGVGATILWFIVACALILIKGSNRQ